MASEGSREIDAARKRLAAARAQKSRASKKIDAADEMAEAAQRMAEAAKKNNEEAKRMAETAKAMAETAKKNNEEAEKMGRKAKENKEEAQAFLQSSQSEVEDAEAFLKEAEERWKVIEVVDSDGENKKAGRRNKKRKGAPVAAVVQPTAAAVAGSAGAATDVEEILVKRAGTPEVNGTYRRCRANGSDALPSDYDSDYPVYSKSGLWKGEAVNFFLYRSKYSQRWLIKCESENVDEVFYWNRTGGNNLPPKAYWEPCRHGTHPTPQLQW